jgi:ABC-type multidrug transport system ATPase subunit
MIAWIPGYSHQLPSSITELAERVAVLEDGTVVEEGRLEGLREGGRFYRRILAT